ncbi:MAG: DUF4169 family protein [Robiginitomaculum sp.]|nr:DUF4169 family protein [Robiginitomaculum sp.]
MTNTINLRVARKAKKRLDKRKSAANNRLKSGQSKVEQVKVQMTQKKLQAHLNAHNCNTDADK